MTKNKELNEKLAPKKEDALKKRIESTEVTKSGLPDIDFKKLLGCG
jgi:hypothetical protein